MVAVVVTVGMATLYLDPMTMAFHFDPMAMPFAVPVVATDDDNHTAVKSMVPVVGIGGRCGSAQTKGQCCCGC